MMGKSFTLIRKTFVSFTDSMRQIKTLMLFATPLMEASLPLAQMINALPFGKGAKILFRLTDLTVL
jgi:hypothetical protein